MDDVQVEYRLEIPVHPNKGTLLTVVGPHVRSTEGTIWKDAQGTPYCDCQRLDGLRLPATVAAVVEGEGTKWLDHTKELIDPDGMFPPDSHLRTENAAIQRKLSKLDKEIAQEADRFYAQWKPGEDVEPGTYERVMEDMTFRTRLTHAPTAPDGTVGGVDLSGLLSPRQRGLRSQRRALRSQIRVAFRPERDIDYWKLMQAVRQ